MKQPKYNLYEEVEFIYDNQNIAGKILQIRNKWYGIKYRIQFTSRVNDYGRFLYDIRLCKWIKERDIIDKI
jgi:hypothetical protein